MTAPGHRTGAGDPFHETSTGTVSPGVCRICGSAQTRFVMVPEMMYGTGEEFPYGECTGCGCLQIVTPPEDVRRLYPDDYYAFGSRRETGLKRVLKRIRAEHVLGRRTPTGWVLNRLAGKPPFTEWAIEPFFRRDHAILDVGSGNGWLLREMWIAGFRRLRGVDPHIGEDTECAPGVVVRKGDVHHITESFDCVMLHHVLEHLSDPTAMLRHTRDLLKPGGTVLVRTPVMGTSAWRTYGPRWVQIDAPRHLIIQSERSLRMVAERAGLSVRKIVYDSTAFQFWGSEQNLRGMPLMDASSVHRRSPGLFSKKELRLFAERAKKLNTAGDGDQACFYLGLA